MSVLIGDRHKLTAYNTWAAFELDLGTSWQMRTSLVPRPFLPPVHCICSMQNMEGEGDLVTHDDIRLTDGRRTGGVVSHVTSSFRPSPVYLHIARIKYWRWEQPRNKARCKTEVA